MTNQPHPTHTAVDDAWNAASDHADRAAYYDETDEAELAAAIDELVEVLIGHRMPVAGFRR